MRYLKKSFKGKRSLSKCSQIHHIPKQMYRLREGMRPDPLGEIMDQGHWQLVQEGFMISPSSSPGSRLESQLRSKEEVGHKLLWHIYEGLAAVHVLVV